MIYHNMKITVFKIYKALILSEIIKQKHTYIYIDLRP